MGQQPQVSALDIVAGPGAVGPAGAVRISRNASGLVASVDGGAPAAISGGTVTPWFSNIATFVRTIDATLIAAPFSSECSDLTLECEAMAAAGTGVASVLTSQPGGVLRSATGATANSFQVIRSKNGISSAYIPSVKTSHWAVATSAKVAQTQATFSCFLGSISDFLTAGGETGIVALQTVSGTKFVCKVGTATSAASTVDLDTAWHTFITVADGVNVNFYIGDQQGNNIVQLSAPQAQSGAPNNPGAWDFYALNLATAANVACDVDKVIVFTGLPT